MKSELFEEIYNGFWPHKPLSDIVLKLAWAPAVGRIDDEKVVNFLHQWARHEKWPPTLHEFLVGMGSVRPAQVSKTPETTYVCDYCGKAISGPVEFGDHISEKHADELATPESVAEIVGGWKKEHTQPPTTAVVEEESPTTGDAEDGSGDADDGDANNGNKEEPTPAADPEKTLSQEISPDTDPVGAWKLVGRNLKDHDGAKTKGRSCTLCDDFAPGMLFRDAPVDMPDASITKHVTIMAGNCWGCRDLGRMNHFGMPDISKENQNSFAWKKFSNMKGTKGLHKKRRGEWVNAALGATRRCMKYLAQEGAEPGTTGEPELLPCKRCGDTTTGSRLLFAAGNGGNILAARCGDCGGSALYAHSMGPDLPALQLGTSAGWLRYDKVFAPDANRADMISAAIERTRKSMIVKPLGGKPSDGGKPSGKTSGNPSEPAPEPDLDDELPC